MPLTTYDAQLEAWADEAVAMEQNMEALYGPPATPPTLPPLTTYDGLLEAIVDACVGVKDKLLDQSPIYHNKDSAYVKTVPAHTSQAELQKIGGKTVVWNQFFEKDKATTFTSRMSYDSGTDTYTATYEEGTTASGNILYIPIPNYQTTHKYYTYFTADATNYVGMRIYIPGSSTYVTNVDYVYSLTNNKGTIRTGGSFSYFGIAKASAQTSAQSMSFRVKCCDLTLMFGAGNEPSTVAEFLAIFPNFANEPYNAGQLLSAGVTEVKSVGINLWDEQWEVGKYNTSDGTKATDNATIRSANQIDVLPSTQYYFLVPYTSAVVGFAIALFYDIDGNFISYTQVKAQGVVVTTPSNAYHMAFFISSLYGTTYNNDICINLSNASVNGNYYPYNAHTYPIPAEIQALEGYGWSVREYVSGVYSQDIYNYIDYENKKYIQNVGKVTLNGSESWTWDSNNALGYTIISNGIITDGTTQTNTYVLSNNPAITDTSWAGRSSFAYTIGMYYGQTRLYCKSSNFTSANDVKTYFTNNPTNVNYVLQTPIETDISAYITDDNLIEVEAGGTLTFENVNGDDYRIPVPSEVLYDIDVS